MSLLERGVEKKPVIFKCFYDWLVKNWVEFY